MSRSPPSSTAPSKENCKLWEQDATINLSGRPANILSRLNYLAVDTSPPLSPATCLIMTSSPQTRTASMSLFRSRPAEVRPGSSETFPGIAGFLSKAEYQIVGRPKRCPVQRLVVVFVVIGAKREDRFYILTWTALRNLLIKHHKAFLAEHGGKRPKKWDSLHCAILENVLTPHLDKWEVVKKCLK